MTRQDVLAVALWLATFSGPAEARTTQPPALIGTYYLDARQHLRRLGYAPVTMTQHTQELCVDRRCTRTRKVNEGFCASDIPSCVFFWRAPSGRYVRIDTKGEGRVKVESIAWTSRSEVRGQKVN